MTKKKMVRTEFCKKNKVCVLFMRFAFLYCCCYHRFGGSGLLRFLSSFHSVEC